MNYNAIKICLLSGLFVVMSCSTLPKVTELPVTADPSAEMSRVDREIQQATASQVNILAPGNFSSAVSSMDEAREARTKNKKQSDILHKISVAQAYLDKANEVANVSKQLLTGVIQERQAALDANAPKYYSKEFNAADKELREATEEIEANRTDTAEKSRGRLEAKYSELELNSIRTAKLGEARSEIEQAAKEGAKKLTSETYAWAQKKMTEDDAIIINNRHNSIAVDQASADAKASAHRLLLLVRQAKSSSAQNPEQRAIQTESDKAAADQALLESEQELATTQKGLEKFQTVTEKNKEKIQALSIENKNLEEKGKLEKQYEAASKEFSASEAEVYKQGDKLLLRMKGLSFPKDQAVIETKNYSLLTKVQKIINNGRAGSVVIEGHTDSTGSKSINNKLSEARAEAVQSYLTAHDIIPSDKISVKGYGDKKPIATNKTKEGRAQNRRVDIIITYE